VYPLNNGIWEQLLQKLNVTYPSFQNEFNRRMYGEKDLVERLSGGMDYGYQWETPRIIDSGGPLSTYQFGTESFGTPQITIPPEEIPTEEPVVTPEAPIIQQNTGGGGGGDGLSPSDRGLLPSGRPFPYGWEADLSGPSQASFFPGFDYPDTWQNIASNLKYGLGIAKGGFAGMLFGGDAFKDPVIGGLMEHLRSTYNIDTQKFMAGVRSLYGEDPFGSLSGVTGALGKTGMFQSLGAPSSIDATVFNTNTIRGLAMTAGPFQNYFNDPILAGVYQSYDTATNSITGSPTSAAAYKIAEVVAAFQAGFGRYPTPLETRTRGMLPPSVQKAIYVMIGEGKDEALGGLGMPGSAGWASNVTDYEVIGTVMGKAGLVDITLNDLLHATIEEQGYDLFSVGTPDMVSRYSNTVWDAVWDEETGLTTVTDKNTKKVRVVDYASAMVPSTGSGGYDAAKGIADVQSAASVQAGKASSMAAEQTAKQAARAAAAATSSSGNGGSSGGNSGGGLGGDPSGAL